MAFNNLGLAYQAKSHYKMALENFNKSLALDPALMEPKSNRALLLLLLGRFEEAWEDYESRLNFTNRNFPMKDANQNSLPIWRGESGKKILVWQEQGIGDEIMFASMLPDLKSARVTRLSWFAINGCRKFLVALSLIYHFLLKIR